MTHQIPPLTREERERIAAAINVPNADVIWLMKPLAQRLLVEVEWLEQDRDAYRAVGIALQHRIAELEKIVSRQHDEYLLAEHGSHPQ